MPGMKAVNGAWPVSQLGSETARPCSRGAAPTASSLASRHRPSSSRQLTTAIERRHAATATSSTPRGSHAFRLSTRPSHLTLRAGARTSNAFAECSAAAFNVLFRGGATTLSKKSLESGKSSTSVQLLEARSKSRCLTPTCRWLRPVHHRRDGQAPGAGGAVFGGDHVGEQAAEWVPGLRSVGVDRRL